MSGADRLPRIKIIRNAGGYWVWQLWSANGRAQILEGTPRYLSRSKAITAANAAGAIIAAAVLDLGEGA